LLIPGSGGGKRASKRQGGKQMPVYNTWGKLNHFLINLVTFPRILEMGSFRESTNGTIRWKCRQGARYTVLPNPYFVFASDWILVNPSSREYLRIFSDFEEAAYYL